MISTHDLTKRSTYADKVYEGDYFISTHDLTKRSTPELYHSNYDDVFQLTTSRRGRQLSCPYGRRLIGYFNSRPHEEVDVLERIACMDRDKFQLTTSRRGRLTIPVSLYFWPKFQLTTSRRGRLSVVTGCSPVIMYFNSRPHEEVDSWRKCNLPCQHISTHDLTKRSTTVELPNSGLSDISTHDLTKRSTYCSRNWSICRRYFNSRPHEEVDLYLEEVREIVGYFNSRPHEEVDIQMIVR